MEFNILIVVIKYYALFQKVLHNCFCSYIAQLIETCYSSSFCHMILEMTLKTGFQKLNLSNFFFALWHCKPANPSKYVIFLISTFINKLIRK